MPGPRAVYRKAVSPPDDVIDLPHRMGNHPYWRTPAVRAAIWVSTSGIVIVLTGAIMDRRVVALLPVDLVTRLALADLVFVSGVAFLFSIPWGSLVGGAAALCGIGVCAILERLWTSWPLRVLDGVGAPHFDRTSVWLMCAGIACVVAGLHHLRAWAAQHAYVHLSPRRLRNG